MALVRIDTNIFTIDAIVDVDVNANANANANAGSPPLHVLGELRYCRYRRDGCHSTYQGSGFSFLVFPR